jgi:membrane glycosyltransferase
VRRFVGRIDRATVQLAAFVASIETIISALTAPIMMVMQSKAVIEILAGRDVGWSPQRRALARDSSATIVNYYVLPTIVGLILAFAAYSVSEQLLFWMFPVIAGLTLAIPIAALTTVGRNLAAAGMLVVSEDKSVS